MAVIETATQTAPPTDPVGRGRGKSTPPMRTRSPGQSRFLLWVTGPALALYLFWTIIPVVFVFVFAFFRYGGILDFAGSDQIVDPERYSGLDNFRTVFADDVFWDAVRNTAIQVGISLPVMIPLAFMLGYYLDRRPPGWRVLSVFFFTPGLISISIKGTIFYSMLSPNGGVNGLLSAIGLGPDGLVDLTTAWYANSATALAVIIFVDLWQGIGWTGVLFAARLASVPAELHEAATMDGAGEWRRMWQVSFGVVRPYVGTLTMLQLLWTLFNSAPLVYILTRGGPGTSSTTLSYLVYQKAFQQQQIGYSQVVGVVLFLVGLFGMLALRRIFREKT